MFKTIVWATDGSKLADATLPLVTELAALHDAKIVAVHVDELFAAGRFVGGSLLADEDTIERKIGVQVGDLRAAGFEVEVELVSSRSFDTAAQIAKTAAKVGADLIVIGTRGESAAASLLHTSVANGLNHHAHCAVLALPPASHIEEIEPERVAAASSR
jgi:nucleotide-binding universal stress UspA family protein